MKKRVTENVYDSYTWSHEGKSRKNSKSFKNIFVFFLICVLISVSIFFFFKKEKTESKIFGNKIYFLSIGTYKKIDDAQTKSNEVALQGAAGYVFSDENFEVIAFAYPTKEKAETVASALSTKKIKTKIVTIEIKRISLKNRTSEEILVINEIVKSIDFFYTLAIKLDTNELTESQIFSKIKNKKSRLGLFRTKLVSATSDASELIVEHLEKISGELDKFMEMAFPKKLLSSGVKNLCLISIVELFFLSSSLAEL